MSYIEQIITYDIADYINRPYIQRLTINDIINDNDNENTNLAAVALNMQLRQINQHVQSMQPIHPPFESRVPHQRQLPIQPIQPRVLTHSEIINATTLCLFRAVCEPCHSTCPISLQNFEPNDIVCVINYCHHVFHANELNRWFLTSSSCPVCRFDILCWLNKKQNKIK